MSTSRRFLNPGPMKAPWMTTSDDHPEALCVRCGVQFPVSREIDEWIRQGEGVRVLCPVCRDLEDELAGEALERQRQPENQPTSDTLSDARYRPQIYVNIGGVEYEDWG